MELGPDGEALGRLPLPVAAEVVRPLPDGFLLATTDPPAAWRVDRRGSLRADSGGRPDRSFETRYGVGELGSGATGAVGLLSGSWAYSDRDWIATRLTSR